MSDPRNNNLARGDMEQLRRIVLVYLAGASAAIASIVLCLYPAGRVNASAANPVRHPKLAKDNTLARARAMWGQYGRIQARAGVNSSPTESYRLQKVSSNSTSCS